MCTLSLTAFTIFTDNLNNIIVAAAVAIGIFALMVEWTYIFECLRGLYILEYKVFRHYVNVLFAISEGILAFIWLTDMSMDGMLVAIFVGFMAFWLLTACICLLVSIFSKVDRNNKAAMRQSMLPCVIKILISVIVLWIAY